MKQQKNTNNKWQLITLGDCLSKIEGGGTPSKEKSEYWNGFIPWASVKDIVTHNPKGTQNYISELGLKNSSSKLISKGTLIVPTRMALGHAVVFDIDVAINQDLKALYPQKNLMNKYLFYWFKAMKKYIEKLGAGSTVFGIQQNELKKIKLNLPPIPEQNRIVSVLATWDKAIELLTKKIEIKKQIKKALVQDLLTGKKRLSGFNGKWKNVEAGKVFSFLRTYAISRENLINNTSNYQGIGNIHYGDIHATYSSSSINLKNISVPSVKDVSFKPNKDDLLINGDLVMADVSEDYEGVGVTVSVHGLENKKVVGGLHTFVLRDYSSMTAERYRQYIFQNKLIRNRLRKIANGVSVYGISKSNLSKILLSLPSIEEQTAIANILNTTDEEITTLEKKLFALKDQKKYLLNNLITGNIRTPEDLLERELIHNLC